MPVKDLGEPQAAIGGEPTSRQRIVIAGPSQRLGQADRRIVPELCRCQPVSRSLHRKRKAAGHRDHRNALVFAGKGDSLPIATASDGKPAAVEEGIPPGGGVALLRSVKALDNLKTANDDQRVGIDIIRRAIEAPVRQIAENAGAEGSIIVRKLREKSDFA